MLVQGILGTKIIYNPLYVVVNVGVYSLTALHAAHFIAKTGDADHKSSCFHVVGQHKWSTCSERGTLEAKQA